MTTRYSNIYSKLYSDTGSIELKGTSSNRLIIQAPALSQNVTLIFPTSVGDIDQALVNSSTPGTLTWADFPNEFTDSTFRIKNASTTSKKIAFSATNIAVSTTRTITMPDSDVDLQYVPNQSVATSASPSFVRVYTGAGLEATPSLAFSGNTSTGIYKIADNNIGISTNGSKRVDIGNTTLAISAGVITTYNDTTESTATNDGSVIIKGGLGIAKTLVPNALKMTNSVSLIDTDTTLAGDSDTSLPTQKAVRRFVLDECTAIDNPTGFAAGTLPSIISFSDVTFTLTLTVPFTYYIRGVKYTKSGSNETIVLASSGVPLTPTYNTYFIYYDGATLSQTSVFDDSLILTKVMVAWIYMNKTARTSVVVGNELHGCSMSPYTHLNLHTSQGTVYGSGGQPSFSTQPPPASDFTITACSIYDEDLKLTTSAKANTTDIMNVLYLKTTSGTTEWTKVQSTGAFHLLSNVLQYNLLTAGSWGLSPVANNQYVLGHVFACNDISNKFFAVMGQATYSTAANARAAASTELASLTLTDLPELVFLMTVIYRYTAGTTPYAVLTTVSGTSYFTDWRKKSINSTAGQTASSHSSLSGLGNDDHLQYVRVTGRTTDALSINYLSNNADTSPPTPAITSTCTETLLSSPSDAYCSGLSVAPTYGSDSGLTVTRHNYLNFNNITVTGTATVTDAAVARFNADAGTHKAVSSGNSGILGTTSGWLKYNLNGTLAYCPIYSSITPSAPEMHYRSGTLSTVGGSTTILTIAFGSNNDKDTTMFVLDAIAIDTGSDTVYTVEALKTTRVIRRLSSSALEETRIVTESDHSNWTLAKSTTNYTISLANPASGRTVGYNLRLYLQKAVGEYPTIS